MKVAVVEFAARGGLAHYAFQLCRALAARGAEVTLVTGTGFELEKLPHAFRVLPLLRLWDPKPGRDRLPRALRPLRRAARALVHYREWARLVVHLRRHRYDVVQLGDLRFPTDLACVLLLRALGVRLADVCHNLLPFAGGARGGRVRGSRLTRAAYRWIYRQFDDVFVHFEVNRRAFCELYDASAARVHVIPHGSEALFAEIADGSVGPADVRARLAVEDGDPLVLLLGTLTRYKGADLAIEALALARRAEPRLTLVLAGPPAADFDVEAHRALAAARGVGDAVRLCPAYVPSREIAAWMQAASVAVFPYREVFQSGAVHLALTFGVPTVATAVGAMVEVVAHERTGLLVAAGDVPGLAAAIVRLVAEPGTARRLGAQAAVEAHTRFGWDRVAATMLAAYGAPRPGPVLAPAGAETR